MAWTAPKTWATGDNVPASDMNTYIRDNSGFLHDPPTARVFHSVDQSITDATDTVLAFDSERFDTDTIHGAGANTKLTATTAGKYLIVANITWEANATGIRFCGIRLNGTTMIGQVRQPAIASVDVDQNPTTLYQLAATDYVEVLVRQESGGALNVKVAGNVSPEFSMVWVSG